MSKRELIYADEYSFVVVKTVWQWKMAFHFNLWIQKEHIIFLPYLIYFVYLRASCFSDCPQQNSRTYDFWFDHTVLGAGRYSDVSFLWKIFIPNGFYSEGFLFRKVFFFSKGFYSERLLLRKFGIKTFRNKNHSEK